MLKRFHQPELQLSCRLIGLVKEVNQMHMNVRSVITMGRQRAGTFITTLQKLKDVKKFSVAVSQKLARVQADKGEHRS